MMFWISRDKDGKLNLWKDKPTKGTSGHFHGGGLRGVFWECLFPEITWDNSPQQIEFKLTEK